ncbi:MAG: response regulator [Sphingobium sp.]
MADTLPPRVLLVEDDPFVAAAMTDLLEHAQFEVDGPHASLSDGVAALADHMPDAAILDIGLDGHDVFMLADDLEQYGIPFLLCSGLPPRGRMKLRFGNHPFVAKDRTGRELVSALRDLLH